MSQDTLEQALAFIATLGKRYSSQIDAMIAATRTHAHAANEDEDDIRIVHMDALAHDCATVILLHLEGASSTARFILYHPDAGPAGDDPGGWYVVEGFNPVRTVTIIDPLG